MQMKGTAAALAPTAYDDFTVPPSTPKLRRAFLSPHRRRAVAGDTQKTLPNIRAGR
jgi:hypothetical protein